MPLAAAETLFELGDLDGVNKELDRIETAETTTDKIRFQAQMLRNKVLRRQGNMDAALEMAAELVQTGKERNYDWDLLDAELLFLECIINMGRGSEATQCHKDCTDLFSRLCEGREDDKCRSRKAVLLWADAALEITTGDLETSLTHLKQSQALLRETPSFATSVNVLNAMGLAHCKLGNLKHALEHYQDCLALAISKGNLIVQSVCHANIGTVFHVKGELEEAMDCFRKCLVVAEETDYKLGKGYSSLQIGWIYHARGDLAAARSAYERGLKSLQQSNNLWYQAWALFYLVRLKLEYGKMKEVQEYLSQLKALTEKLPSPYLDQLYSVANALLLRQSGRVTTVAQAQVIFSEVADGSVHDIRLNVLAMLNLCDMLLDEVRATGGREAFMEMEEMVGRLAEIARDQDSYTILTETYLLRSKIALVELQVEEARRFLQEAQEIAEEKELVRLAMRVSREHDELLAQLGRWRQLISTDSSLRERIELAGLEGLLDNMIRHGGATSEESHAETPVMLLVVSQSGLTVYSKQFADRGQIDEQVIGGFVTALDSFLRQAFAAKGHVERIKHEEYTLLMKEDGPLTYCYVFNGLSYDAIKKLERFVKESQANEGVREYLIAEKVKQSPHQEHMVEDIVKDIFKHPSDKP